ncbi:hypothetical protein [Kitasatospora sp. NPDC008115]|uniref:hypothetical protein n=1 Tax=Kitasatospora sp. NPDC008115 TaxID=3364022 RepID=UPI0036EB866B
MPVDFLVVQAFDQYSVERHEALGAGGRDVADAGGSLDEVQALLGHKSPLSSQPYLIPDRSRLREAVEHVPTPRVNPQGEH